MKSTNPMAKKYFEKKGYAVEIEEHWVSFGGKGGVRKDFLECFDGVALRPPEKPIAWQSTIKAEMGRRKKKILNSPLGRMWIESGCRAIVLGFVKFENKWRVIEEEIKL